MIFLLVLCLIVGTVLLFAPAFELQYKGKVTFVGELAPLGGNRYWLEYKPESVLSTRLIGGYSSSLLPGSRNMGFRSPVGVYEGCSVDVTAVVSIFFIRIEPLKLVAFDCPPEILEAHRRS